MRESVKTTIKVVALLCVATVSLGFYHAHREAEGKNYETVVYHERVHQGDTFNTVIEQYYNPQSERECFDEWQTYQKARNKRLFFYPDGKPRMLQPNDIICIEVRERVAR